MKNYKKGALIFVLFFMFDNMIRIEQTVGGECVMENNQMMSESMETLKAFLKQFEMVIPEEKRAIIYNTIEQVESSGGIQEEAQAQAILMQLIKGLGL